MPDRLANRSETFINGKETFKMLGCAQEGEVNGLLDFLKMEYSKYVPLKIIYDLLEEYVHEDNKVNPDLKAKLGDILLGHSLSQTLRLKSKNELGEMCLIGLKETDCVYEINTLSYLERNSLQDILLEKLSDKESSIRDYFAKLKDQHLCKLTKASSSVLLQLSPEDGILVNYRSKLISEQNEYVSSLLSLQKLLVEIEELRLKKLPDVVEHKIKESQVRGKMNHLKSLMLFEKCKLDMFTETTFALKAYKQLIEDIKKQQQHYQAEVKNLEEWKEKYDQVSCKQYDDILKSFLQYKASVERKKKLHECLKN